MDWSMFWYLIGGGLMVFWAFRIIKNSPGAFTKANISKSFYTLGLLALFLMGVIVFCIWLLRG